MAIIPGFPGVELTVRVDGQPLTEYDDPNNSSQRYETIKFIESTPGKAFTLHYEIPADTFISEHGVELEYSINGKLMSARCIKREGYYQRQPHASASIDSYHRCENGSNYLYSFAFGHLATTEEASESDNDVLQRFPNIGTIELKLYWTKNYRWVSEWTLPEPVALESIHEKLLKGRSISQTVNYDRKLAPSQGQVQYRLYDFVSKDPFAACKFTYRSKRDLQLSGVIPSSPIIIPHDEGDDIEQLGEAELRARVRELQGQLAARPKQEDGEKPDVSNMSPERRRRVEYVDLTDD